MSIPKEIIIGEEIHFHFKVEGWIEMGMVEKAEFAAILLNFTVGDIELHPDHITLVRPVNSEAPPNDDERSGASQNITLGD